MRNASLFDGCIGGECNALQKKFDIGSAGLFSTVPDLLKFLKMILNQGTYNGYKYFNPETIALMQTNQIAHLGQSTGLGWELNQPRFMGKYCSEVTFGKTGFTGCSCLIDLSRHVALVILSNYIYPKRKTSYRQLNQFRSQIADLIFSRCT